MADYTLTVTITVSSDTDITTAEADAARTIKEALDTLDWPDLDFDEVKEVRVTSIEKAEA